MRFLLLLIALSFFQVPQLAGEVIFIGEHAISSTEVTNVSPLLPVRKSNYVCVKKDLVSRLVTPKKSLTVHLIKDTPPVEFFVTQIHRSLIFRFLEFSTAPPTRLA